MKSNKGFFLVETALVLLFVFTILINTIQSYNSCLRNLVRKNELSQAFEYCERYLVDGTISAIPPGLEINTIDNFCCGYNIVEVQVEKEHHVIFNLVKIE